MQVYISPFSTKVAILTKVAFWLRASLKFSVIDDFLDENSMQKYKAISVDYCKKLAEAKICECERKAAEPEVIKVYTLIVRDLLRTQNVDCIDLHLAGVDYDFYHLWDLKARTANYIYNLLEQERLKLSNDEKKDKREIKKNF